MEEVVFLAFCGTHPLIVGSRIGEEEGGTGDGAALAEEQGGPEACVQAASQTRLLGRLHSPNPSRFGSGVHKHQLPGPGVQVWGSGVHRHHLPGPSRSHGDRHATLKQDPDLQTSKHPNWYKSSATFTITTVSSSNHDGRHVLGA